MNPALIHSLRRTFDEPEADRQLDPEPNHRDSTDLNTRIAGGPLALVELILKNQPRLDRLIRQRDQQTELLTCFLLISLVGFAFYGVAMTMVFSTASVWPQLFRIDEVLAHRQESLLRFVVHDEATLAAPWLNGDAARLTFAYAVGLIAATGICLPSLYFYGLLAGIRMTAMDVVIHAVKSKAVAAVALVGILPIYATAGLAISIFHLSDTTRDYILLVGLAQPFIAGLAGTRSLYLSLSALTDTMAAERRIHRECFLQRLVLSWAAVYSAVTPVLIFTLWQRLQG